MVVWDNSVARHMAVLNWLDNLRRCLARITPQANRSDETPF